METPADDVQLTALGVRRINTDTDPEELVLPEASEQRLRRIADWLVQPAPVMREWGLHRYIDGGLRALFRGPPGTGKTMAAIAVGRWSGRALFHVDLAGVVGKYIGDTSKQLQRIFEVAEKQNAILLFDEADALFADDADAGIGYLLRRLEPYEGLAILTSSRAGELGEEVATRLDGIVDFPMPDEDARHELWCKLLASAKLAKSADLDARALAKRFELSGADILRTLRIGALLAASAGKPLDMDLLEHSAEERTKMRKGE